MKTRHCAANMCTDHATGEYTVDRHQWQPEKWALYGPSGVCLRRFEKKEEADKVALGCNRLRWMRDNRPDEFAKLKLHFQFEGDAHDD